jgi:hypothetical protein
MKDILAAIPSLEKGPSGAQGSRELEKGKEIEQQ